MPHLKFFVGHRIVTKTAKNDKTKTFQDAITWHAEKSKQQSEKERERRKCRDKVCRCLENSSGLWIIFVPFLCFCVYREYCDKGRECMPTVK